MDNVTLINQARSLYAQLHLEQYVRSYDNNDRFHRLDNMVGRAYYRYLRRLNRCVLCYQHRLNDCKQWASNSHTTVLPNGRRAFIWSYKAAKNTQKNDLLLQQKFPLLSVQSPKLNSRCRPVASEITGELPDSIGSHLSTNTAPVIKLETE
jgi:hypothetical protein